ISWVTSSWACSGTAPGVAPGAGTCAPPASHSRSLASTRSAMSSISGSSPAGPRPLPTASSTSPERWPARGWLLRAPALPAAEHGRHAPRVRFNRASSLRLHLAEPARKKSGRGEIILVLAPFGSDRVQLGLGAGDLLRHARNT